MSEPAPLDDLELRIKEAIVDIKKGACVAPGCGAETPDSEVHLCDACEERVAEAMARARPALLEMMHKERTEAEAWLSSPWLPPSRRWAVLDSKHHEVTLDSLVQQMVELTSDAWRGDGTLGFVDDAAHARHRARQQEYAPESVPSEQTGWRIGSDSPAMQAWRKHLGSLIRPVLERALVTFPRRWAGYEIKTALVQQDGYEADAFSMALEEIDEGTGGWPLSELAVEYLDLRFDPRLDWHFESAYPSACWWRYVVLAPEIMAILDAVKAAEA